ncbi:DUF4214 domain-containing protein [Duganella sp. FT92W]|uniref:DUF4214 domain-containing protein n=1 Tax=Pseudoduganella rivuli TaxID=2666085 RepID=A0A7X2IJV4_9BURK|nr:DUF4214 domain-containing protein [Pseudoduganella rivuli]MRV71150.1 DUF4214 domain-containing protein [Pseudoduganella rivuli]
MAIIQWAAGETKSAVFTPGDTIAISNIHLGGWKILTIGNSVALDAYGDGRLTLNSADGSPVLLSQLAMTWPDGGAYLYAGDNHAVKGGVGQDFLVGSDQDNTLDGGPGSDYLTGNGGNDTLTDTAGNNLLLGGGGDDMLTGGAGYDVLEGEDGNDTLDSGGGNANALWGGPGDDRYIIRSRNDYVGEEGGNDSGMIHVDWYKTSESVEHWEWAPGVQKLPYWIDALLWSYSTYVPAFKEPGDTVSYSFAEYASDFSSDHDKLGFAPFTTAQRNYTRKALDYISSVIDVQFAETSNVDDGLNILMGNNTQENSGGYASYLQFSENSPLLLANDPDVKFPGRDDGGYLYSILMHELGHSLGLKHPFSHPDAGGGTEQGPYLPDAEDYAAVTLMSYSGIKPIYNLSFSPLDIAALQYLWGVSPQAHAGDSRYVLTAGESQMIWDGSGNDTIDGAGLQQDLTLYLEPGYWSHAGAKAATITAAGQYTVNFGTQIENALGGAGNDAITGNALANRLDGGAGNDTLAGGAGDDVLDGGAGNDVLDGGAGNDTITGGDGVDAALYDGLASAYTVSNGANGWTVSGASGADTLAGVERLRFTDAVLALDTGKDGVAGQVYRLYQAAFDRKPDTAGVGYWIGQSDHGVSMSNIAESFLRSDEFAKLYGGANPTSENYLTQLYHNVLHRPYDQAGYDYWLGVLKQGTARADVLLSFAASDENVNALAKVIGQGFDYTYYS